MLKDDIAVVNQAFIDICHPEAVIDAWYRIKVELLKIRVIDHCANQSNNTQSNKVRIFERRKHG